MAERLSRRGFLGLSGAGALSVGAMGVGAGALGTIGMQAAVDAAQPSSRTHAFHGEHQAGILTPAQDRMHFASFDMAPDADRAMLVALMRDWSEAAARMTLGESAGPVGPVSGDYQAPPDDTGEALGLTASSLTITFGFGASLFSHDEHGDRFGIAGEMPAELSAMPHFAGDSLDDARCGGDLCIQACADDPQVAVHAIRNLSRMAFGRATLRWSQLGFGRTSSTTREQQTPRNMFGFKDGTANIRAGERGTDAAVWAAEGWMAGGSYLVARRIRMTVETWDRASLREQERVIGRSKGEGAPLSGGEEQTEPDFRAPGRDGPLIDADSHVALAHPSANDGATMLRRGYSFVDGNDELGRLDAGLFFIAFQADPRAAFVPVQQRLAASDLMNEYVRASGQALFAVPPGCAPGGYVGETLLG